MSFLDSAESCRVKARAAKVKAPVLIGLSALVLFVLALLAQNMWQAFHHEGLFVETTNSEDVSYVLAEEEREGAAQHEETKKTIMVHIGGAVQNPGVYTVEEGDRLQAAIEAAGGFLEDAAEDAINPARVINDGEQVIVPTLEEFAALPPAEHQDFGYKGKVSINTASVQELCTLPGIGEATAQKIVSDREAKGPFSSLEDLMRVSGIGEKKFEALVELISL